MGNGGSVLLKWWSSAAGAGGMQWLV